MTETFTYKPLIHAAEELRLIRILPRDQQYSSQSDQNSSDLVSCHLDNYELKDTQISTAKPPLNWETDHSPAAEATSWRYSWGDFVALSYTWGDPNHTRKIVLNGHETIVRSNLEAALRALRDRSPMQQGMLIWIDALCINQDDVPERNEEVKRMRTIYKAARDVVVWLGEKEHESGKAMRLIKALAKSCRDGTDNLLGDELRKDPERFGIGAWRALGQLMNRHYWGRLWIMQEIAMGNKDTPILCGNELARWGEIYDGTYIFGTRNVDLMFTYVEKESNDAGVRYSGLNRNRIIHLWDELEVQSGKTQSQFMAMLDLGRKSAATDSRDKVYGLMGLMPAEVARGIQPNYEESLPAIYMSFAKSVITSTQSLELLEQCTGPTPNMPSWAPDWTNGSHFRLFSGRSCYHASLSKSASFHFPTDRPMQLSVRGFQIGVIDGLGASYYESLFSDAAEDALVQPIHSNHAYGTDEGLRDALWRVLVGNRTPNGKMAPKSYASLLYCPVKLESEEALAHTWRGRKAFDHLLGPNLQLQIAGRDLASFFPATGLADPEMSRDALERVFRLHRSRRLAITDEGHMGLVPIPSRKGDFVFILLGCNVPMVLRAAGAGMYQVIGGAYIQGFMEGEEMTIGGGVDEKIETVELV